jgi:hypothetical protein
VKTAEQFAASRRYVQAALDKIEAGKPLDNVDRLVMTRVLKVTLAGHDPRTDLGIEPAEKKGGSPVMAGDLNLIRAAHYLSIRTTEPLEKTAAMIVSEIHGLKSLSTIREVAKKNHRTATLLVASMPAQEIAELSELHARMHRKRTAVKR